MKFIWLAAFTLMTTSLVSAAAPTGPAAKLIAHYKMEKIPVEGAWFALTYTSTEKLAAEALPARYGAPRTVGGAIYALVTREDFSALHKLKTDEIWHFYVGDPIELLLLHPDGRDEVVVLGVDIAAGQQPQFTVPAGVWMGARPVKATAEAYGFFGTTMAPGFDYADFEPGYRDELQKTYPARKALIAELTRAELATRPAAAPAPAVAAAPAMPTVFTPESIATVAVAPGVDLRELVGRVSKAKSERLSVARFALAAGKGTGSSHTKVAEEVFLIISGRGTVVVSGEASPVQTGSVVLLKPGVSHSLTAAADSALEFYAITSPAFSPDDYVVEPGVK
jgi:predicted cupin superfamily sugar epimerase/mannose-6-phosphate isomerase-like protein (cupin superfamily)